MKKDGLLLATLPSGGSDWFASCIKMAKPELSYAREFFCPACNWKHAERLERDMGDTMFKTTKKLCTPMTVEQADRLLEDTWRKESFDFCKENYLPFKLPAFAEFFDVVIAVRDYEDTFPPNRRRVMRWYEHFWGALFWAGLLDEESVMLGTTPSVRAAIGHFYFRQQLIECGKELGIPVIDLSAIVRGDESHVRQAVAHVPCDTNRLAFAVMATRENIPRPREHFEQWAVASEIVYRLRDRQCVQSS